MASDSVLSLLRNTRQRGSCRAGSELSWWSRVRFRRKTDAEKESEQKDDERRDNRKGSYCLEFTEIPPPVSGKDIFLDAQCAGGTLAGKCNYDIQ